MKQVNRTIPLALAGESREGLWDTSELARFMKVSDLAIRAMRKRGEIPENCVRKIGRRIRFLPWEIRKWLKVEETQHPA